MKYYRRTLIDYSPDIHIKRISHQKILYEFNLQLDIQDIFILVYIMTIPLYSKINEVGDFDVTEEDGKLYYELNYWEFKDCNLFSTLSEEEFFERLKKLEEYNLIIETAGKDGLLGCSTYRCTGLVDEILEVF